jgi:hypothetical protein
MARTARPHIEGMVFIMVKGGDLRRVGRKGKGERKEEGKEEDYLYHVLEEPLQSTRALLINKSLSIEGKTTADKSN